MRHDKARRVNSTARRSYDDPGFRDVHPARVGLFENTGAPSSGRGKERLARADRIYLRVTGREDRALRSDTRFPMQRLGRQPAPGQSGALSRHELFAQSAHLLGIGAGLQVGGHA
jgi:hypothetical protein